ncbi:MAG TPA: DUF4124 domain-containing protein [Xanthomonadaceae bacterium]|nr:DUF4124 domain-containing protein [Xanthomonadaceae bacterium]
MIRILAAALAATMALACGGAEAQKLYRWVDKDGKVRYSDALPPEAVDQAREELNKQGMAVKRVDRAMTPEERAELEAAAASQARREQLQAEQAKRDHILLASYPRESDLARSYQERFDLVAQSVTTARMGIEEQSKALDQLLQHAATRERNGQPVPEDIVGRIRSVRDQVEQQQNYLTRREAERVALDEEFQDMLERYRELRERADAEAAAKASG